MKKLFTSIALFMSLAAAGQKAVSDTTITDSTALIQIRYLNYFINKIEGMISDKVTAKEWKELMTVAEQVVGQSAAELRRKREKK